MVDQTDQVEVIRIGDEVEEMAYGGRCEWESVVGAGRNSTSRELARYILREKGGQGGGVNGLVKVSVGF